MCFISLMYRTAPGHAVVLAANRDEFLDRPSVPPAALAPGVWGGRDLRAGGTWLGVNAGGRVVAVTNIATMPAPVPDPRSRGLLCLDLLKLPSHRDCQGVLEYYVLEHHYCEFNLLAVDEEDAWIATYTGGELTIADLDSGFHFIGNGLPDDKGDPKVRGAGKLMRPVADIHEAVGMMMTACRDHGRRKDHRDAICMHGCAHGTRSSSVIAIRDGKLAESLYFFADGEPCKAEYHNYSALLAGV